MKFQRNVLIAVLGFLALSFHGCSGGDDKPSTPTQPISTEEVKPEEVAVPELEEHKQYTKEDFFTESGFQWELIEELHKKYDFNRCLKHLVLNKEKINGLAREQQERVYNIAKSGLLLAHDSSVGVYAQEAQDYYNYSWLLQGIMFDYQKAAPDAIHTEDWQLDEGVNTRVGDGSKTYSLRIRVARNPSGEPLPASCKLEDFLRIEKNVSDVLEHMEFPEFKTKFDEKKVKSTIYTLTPNHPKAGQTVSVKVASSKSGLKKLFGGSQTRKTEYVFVDYKNDKEAYKGYQARGIFSGDPTEDPALSVGDINNEFPAGRATWDYTDGTTTIRIYINEEDTLRIQMLTKGNDVGNLFRDMKSFLDAFETALKNKNKNLAFAKDPKLGYLASCPSNVGTGMRSSAQMLIPALLAKEGYDINDSSDENQKTGAEILTKMSNSDAFKSNDLQLRGGLGEYTAPGKGGKIDLSYKKRTFVTEKQIIMKLIEAMQYTEGLEVDASPKPALRKGNTQAKIAA